MTKEKEFSLEEAMEAPVDSLSAEALEAIKKGFLDELKVILGRTKLNIKSIIEKQNLPFHPKSRSGGTLLHYAAGHGHKEIALFLLKNRANINARNQEGYTPLHLAVYFGKKDMVKLLLDNGAYVSPRSNSGETPIHLCGDKLILEKLLTHQANIKDKGYEKEALLRKPNINDVDDEKETLLHKALDCQHELNNEIKFLLDQGARTDLKDLHGNTALHIAVFFGNITHVKLLLQYGTNLTSQNNEEETPLALAKKLDEEDIAAYLEKFMEKTSSDEKKENLKPHKTSSSHLSTYSSFKENGNHTSEQKKEPVGPKKM